MKPRVRSSAITLFLLALTLAGALLATPAEESAPPADAAELARRVAQLEQVVAGLQAELARLQAALPAPPAPPASAAVDEVAAAPAPLTIGGEEARLLPSRSVAGGTYGVSDTKVEIHGFVDLEYVDSGPEGSRGGVSTFDTHHANVFFDVRLRPDLTAHAEFEYEHSGDTVEVDQAFVAWHPTNWLTLEAGRFYTPFGIERFVWYSPTSELVSRPVALREIVPGNFYANGLQASGIVHNAANEPRFTYEVAITDGLGASAATNPRDARQTRDNNSNRALSGRVAWVGYPRWELGASYHTQAYDNAGDLDLTMIGADFSGRYRGFELRGEWVESLAERALAGRPLADLEKEGWYSQLAYRFYWDRELFPSLSLSTRYDDVDFDRAVVGGNDRTFWSVGLNAAIYEHFRLKLEYQFADEKGRSLDNDTFLGQVVVDF